MKAQEKLIYKQVIEEQPYCQMCGSPYVQLHHVYGGSNRKNSTKHKMIVALCKEHHDWVHSTNYSGFKIEYQMKFEKNHTRDEFIRIFGKSYL